MAFDPNSIQPSMVCLPLIFKTLLTATLNFKAKVKICSSLHKSANIPTDGNTKLAIGGLSLARRIDIKTNIRSDRLALNL
jgi:hypothetical protein